MSDFVTLTCPSCGGKLKVTSDIERFACAHCGTEHIVKRGDGIIALSPVLNAIAGVKSSVDILANDVLLRRAKEAKAQLDQEIAEIRSRLNTLNDKKSKISIKKLQSEARSTTIIAITLIILSSVYSLGYFTVASVNDNGFGLLIGFWIVTIPFSFVSRMRRNDVKMALDLEKDLRAALLSKQLELEKHKQTIAKL